jgi:indolepyruvate ferredoxin oxidoreductase alpha subunit
METLLGDEAIALGAVDAGLSAAFAYPGTPSTEIMEWLRDAEERGKADIVAQWCANEKTAYESALGASFAGRRTMVSMKHVGLNVAMDPFVNSALVRVNGGLVVVVADDPGMHSSQDEQDSRYLAAFARIPCLEPATQQEAYDMTREAFDLSERHEVPVMIRITTRLAHSRAIVLTGERRKQNEVKLNCQGMSWILMPSVARKRWRELLAKQEAFKAISAERNPLTLSSREFGVITTGLGRQYWLENAADFQAKLGAEPSTLHVGFYPAPYGKIRELAAHVKTLLVVEEGNPVLEEEIRGVLPSSGPAILGKVSGELPYDGELSPDLVRKALGLAPAPAAAASALVPPTRPPQLCQGCPHVDSYGALKEALSGYPTHAVTSDIGCYTLGALPPYEAIDSCVDMGASIGMARGAAEAGLYPTVAVIGDSTFYHSGLTNLIDAVAHGTNTTVVILDNDTTGMTGAQPTIMPSSRLEPVLRGIGVERLVVLRAHRLDHAKNVEAIKAELAHQGPSVIVMVRECIEWVKKARKA